MRIGKMIDVAWQNGYFRLFVVLSGMWVFPFIWAGLNKDLACLLYLGLFWFAALDNNGVYWSKYEK